MTSHRNIGLVARGYRYFRQLHEDRRAPLYLTTIAKGNDYALSVLAKGRARLPRYHAAGEYHTAIIPVTCVHRRRVIRQGVEIRPATVGDMDHVLRFLARLGPSRQFFPRYDRGDFFEARGTFRDLRPADLLVAFSGPRMVGMLGGWDQHRYRQTVVERLHGLLRWSRPVYNCLAYASGRARLPKPGEGFRYVTGTLPLVDDDDPVVFTALLESLLANLRADGHEYLLIGMHEKDPLLKLVQDRATTSYVTGVYYACWSDGETLRGQLDERPPYLELGCL